MPVGSNRLLGGGPANISFAFGRGPRLNEIPFRDMTGNNGLARRLLRPTSVAETMFISKLSNLDPVHPSLLSQLSCNGVCLVEYSGKYQIHKKLQSKPARIDDADL